MLKISIVLIVSLCVVAAFPASDYTTLDKASQNDISVNSVSPRAIADEQKDVASPQVSVTATGSVGITAPGDTSVLQYPSLPPPSKVRPGNMFARLIDDIFQIPISVLQSVTKLLTNPFVQKKDGGT